MTRQSRRILLVSPLPPPHGGVPLWTERVLREANRQTNLELRVVDIAPRWRAIHDLGVAKRIIGGAVQFVVNYVVFLRALRNRPDVVHLTTPGSLAGMRDIAMCATARLFRVPVVYHIRFGRVPEIASRRTLEWRVLAKAMQASSVVMAITTDSAEAIERCLPGVRVEYVPNPIDQSVLPTPASDDSSRKTALFLGWVLPTKGVEELVGAWSAVDPDDWELLIAGPGDVGYQQRLIEQYNPRNLRFLGELEHTKAMDLMARCDVFVLPSYTEGFPNAVLEAMALGRPIIATSVGAVPDMLSDGCGLLIPPRDAGKLQEALVRLFHDHSLRWQMGERARAKAQSDYSMNVVFARYQRIWESLIPTER